ncbi:MAG: hypothetical protein ACRDHM_04920 [Actinomycetota bacterium]
MQPRRLVPPLLALLTGLTPAAASADAGPAAEVTVSIDRLVFPDGYYRADFTTSGACAPASDAVLVLASSCGGDVTDTSSGTLRMAKLGFDASRRVEAVPSDVPFLETGQASAREQLDRVLVRVLEAGDLRVEISGSAAGGLDPRPVAGSASAGGTIVDRSAVWSVANAGPGMHEFSVRFAPGAPAGFAGTFLPKVTVTRTVSSDRLLDHVGAPPPPMSPVAVQRTSTLVMAQHVAPAYGPPSAGTQPFISPPEAFPTSFETHAWLDASGAYNAPASGTVQAASVGRLDEIAPGSVGVVDTVATLNSRPWIPGADKVIATPGIRFDPDTGDVSVIDHTVATASPAALSIPYPHGPTAGTFWDGDSAMVGAVAGIGELSADREGPPQNEQGRIVADWNGNTSVAWSGLWANTLPGGEPNALNHAKYKRDVENAALGAAGYPGGYGPFPVTAMTSATIPVISRGGDMDTRGGGLLEGEPVTIRVPAGHTFAGAGTFTFWMGQTKYGHAQASSPEGLTITPQMEPGGVWMESTQDGYDRDWANLHVVVVFSTELGREFDGGMIAESVAVVPEGARGAVDFLDADGGSIHRNLSPGVWRVTLSPGGVSARVLEGSGGF